MQHCPQVSARYRTSKALYRVFQSDEKSFDLTLSTRRVAYEFNRLVSLIAQRPTRCSSILHFSRFSIRGLFTNHREHPEEDRIRLFLGANITPALPSSRSSHDLT